MGTTFNWKVEAVCEGMTLKEYLINQKSFSRRLLTNVKSYDGGLCVNGEEVTVRFCIHEGDNIFVSLPPEEKGNRMIAEDLPLSILYEDEYCLVVDKQPNMAVIPSSDHPQGTLSNAILHYYKKNDLANTVHLVNRLDRDTSGAMLVAKDRYTHHLLSIQQQEGLIDRCYMAIAEGCLATIGETIDKPIGRKEGSIIERRIDPNGQRAVTHFRVEQRLKDKTLLSLKLETGRTHQIRVHLASIGHPLLGDTLYGGIREEISRQALHSTVLSFIHPFTKERIEVHAPLPTDFETILNRSR